MRTAAFGLYSPGVDLDCIVNELTRAGFSKQGVCLLLPKDHPASETLRILRSGPSGPDAEAQIENVLAWLKRFGAVVIPGVGSFVAARDFVSGIFGGRSTAKSCDRVLLGLGIHEPDAQRYEESIHMGSIFIFVSCDGIAHAYKAREVLQKAGAQEASWLGEPCARAA